MIYAFAALFVFQLIGEFIVQWTHLPLPGPLVGMALMLVAMLIRGRIPDALERTADKLFSHMMLFFIPIVTGVMMHFERVANEGLAFIIACVVGSAVSLVVTALTLQWMLQRTRQKSLQNSLPPESGVGQ
jgi:holin-like protein